MAPLDSLLGEFFLSSLTLTTTRYSWTKNKDFQRKDCYFTSISPRVLFSLDILASGTRCRRTRPTLSILNTVSLINHFLSLIQNSWSIIFYSWYSILDQSFSNPEYRILDQSFSILDTVSLINHFLFMIQYPWSIIFYPKYTILD